MFSSGISWLTRLPVFFELACFGVGVPHRFVGGLFVTRTAACLISCNREVANARYLDLIPIAALHMETRSQHIGGYIFYRGLL